jgi:O-antigen/teichoic acid export membrane protein
LIKNKIKSPRFKRLAKEGGWIIVGQIASVFGSLVLLRVITGYLEPSEYGRLALGLTIAGLVNQVLTGGVLSAISRFYSIAAEANDLPGFLFASRRLMGFATVGVVVITLLSIGGLILLGYSQWIGLVIVIMIFSILTSYNAVFNNIQNAARQRAVNALHGGLESWLKIALAISLIFWLGNSSIAVVIGYSLSCLIVIGSQLFFLRNLLSSSRIVAPKYINWQHQMWNYSWPIMAGGLFNWASFASQSWALELFTSTENVGRFYALMQIGYTPISLAGGLLLGFLMPILFSKAGDPENHDRVKNISQIVMKISIYGLGSTFLVSAISFFAHDKVFEFFVAPKYRDISIYMPLVVLAAGFLQVSAALASIISVKNKTHLFLPLSLVGNSFIALLNLYATSRWGLTGLTFSMVIGHGIHLIWMGVLVFNNK